MDSMTPHPPTLGYEDVERVLADLFAVKPRDREGWFRGKLIYLRRNGLTPPSGRGRVIAYDREWITKWFLALLLTLRLDRDPAKVIQFLMAEWSRRVSPSAVDRGEGTLREIAARARESKHRDDHVILTIDHDLSGALTVRYMTGIRAMEAFGYSLAEDGRLVMVFDLTVALRRLDDAIDKATMPPEPPKKTVHEILHDLMRRQGKE
jgi:hypothetical protein